MKSYLLHLLVILALSLGVSVPAVADGDEGAFKLEGAWVARVLPDLVGQWSYVITSDPSGKRGTAVGSVDVGFNANFVCDFTDPEDQFDPTDSESPILVSMVMIGRHTASYSAIWYGLADLGPSSPISNAIVVIGTTTGVIEFVEPGKAAGTHNFALYYPDADGDGDGYPDPGVEPACTFQLSTVDTRLPMPQ